MNQFDKIIEKEKSKQNYKYVFIFFLVFVITNLLLLYFFYSKGINIIDNIEAINKHILNKLIINNIFNNSKNKRYIKIFYNGDKLSNTIMNKEYETKYLIF